MKNKLSTIIKKAGAVLLTAACLFSLCLPFAKSISGNEIYECVWSDGSTSKESYTSAYQSLAGMDEMHILLARGGMTGKIKSAAGQVYSVLESGDLGELLACTYQGTRLDAAGVYRTFSKRVWYSGEYFVWTGKRVKRVSSAKGEELVLLNGSIPSRVVQETNASTVYLRANASVKADAFAGSNVKYLRTEAPYSVVGRALYMETAGGKRLIAALPTVKKLTLDGALKFADEGALIACQSLTTLTLPFFGSAVSNHASKSAGEIGYLFSNGKEYRIPKTLSYIRVTGGRIAAFAFYACPHIKEIDACGVDPNEISEQAFLGVNALEVLHTPKRGVLLTGEFSSHTAQCGCTIYQRIHAQK